MESVATSTPLLNGGSHSSAGAAVGKSKAKNTIEAVYQKKSQLEHILLRPDTYIGSVEPVTETMWVYDPERDIMVQRELTYVPGLYKIFDEILVNAADNKQRDENMNCIKININAEQNVISIWNNGKGIPVVEHKDEKMFVPTMIFGHLLTSSNYNDEEQKVTGGRNGYGAKLCNIFSTKFTVETSSREYKRRFKQTWKENMTKATSPTVDADSSEDFTQVTFSPDLSKFKMESLDKDIVDLMTRRAYDVAASTRGVKVFLNDKRLPIKSFKDYIDLYTKDKEDDTGTPLKIVYECVNPRWEIAVTISERGFQQVSFVNSIATTKGGRHVDYVTDMLIKQLLEIIKKKKKGGVQIKPFQIKNHLWIFVNCLVVNPTFDSQTKEHMTLQAKHFGSKCAVSEKFIAQASKAGIVESVLTWAKFKEQTQLQKISGKKQSKLKGVPKLEDANDAGTRNSIDCTLILTEGDSAKTLAVSGLGVVGRDKYGVFPLRGKLLNVREASHKQIMDNAEINNIVKIVGLQYKKKYETIDDLKTLRYGRLMIMTDQDQDGSHIKGLIINFIHHNWPSLLRLPFLEEFITPIIKATKGKEEYSFFSLPEFEEWKNEKDNWHTYKIKYYKGLGTSTSKEAKEYFSNMARHRILFKHRSDDDDSHITMAFSKKMVDARKDWLSSWMTESKRRKELGLGEDYLYAKDTRAVTYTDFINKELVLFSNMDNERSIPSMVDGLKPGSRKVLFTCLKRNDKREIKVAQLAGSVAEHSAYHHGEISLMSTIINLAQNFVGSNNINLLQPIGQFGTRLQGGKDAASPRYIFTMLSPLTRLIFHPHDDPLLKYLRDDNLKIEPMWYIPIIPMVLVNGAEGIGTGWMTKIPNHNPREIIQNLKAMIRGEDPVPMKPWYKNFLGEIEKLGDSRYITNGEVSILSDEKIEITELPVGVWTQNYKESCLEVMLHGANEKAPSIITDYKEYNTDTTVKFVVTMTREKFKKIEQEGFHRVFKLQSSMSVSSMCSFDKDSVLRRHDSTLQIMKEFFDVRMEFYGKRKVYMEGMLQAEALKLSNQARFIVEKCDGDLRIENRKKKEMITELIRRGYETDPVRLWKIKQDKESALEDETPPQTEDDSQTVAEPQEDSSEDYEYLLGMKLWSLTLEKKNELLKKRDEKQAELKSLQKKSPADLWNDDLDALLVKLDEVEAKEREDEESTKSKSKVKEKGPRKKQLGMASDVLPSPHAIRIIPRIDEEMIKKYEKAQAAKENKGKRKKDKEEGGEEVDSPDGEGKKEKKKKAGGIKTVKPASAKKGKDEEKKSPKKKGTKKKRDWSGSDEFSDSDIDSDIGGDAISARTPARTTSRRAAANIKFKFSDDDDSSSNSDEKEFYDNVVEPADKRPAHVDSSDQEEGENPKPTIVESDSEDEKISKPKKTSPKKKPPPKKKSSESEDEFVISDDDSDFEGSSKKKPKAPAKSSIKKKPPPKKKGSESDDELVISDDDSDFEGTSKMKKKPKAPAVTKKKSQNVTAKPTKPKKTESQKPKKAIILSDSENDMFDDSPFKPTVATKRKILISSGASASENEFVVAKKDHKNASSDDIFDSLLKEQPKRTPKPVVTKSAYIDDDDSDSFKSDSDSDDYKPAAKKPKAAASKPKAPARKAAAKKKKYSDSEDDF